VLGAEPFVLSSALFAVEFYPTRLEREAHPSADRVRSHCRSERVLCVGGHRQPLFGSLCRVSGRTRCFCGRVACSPRVITLGASFYFVSLKPEFSLLLPLSALGRLARSRCSASQRCSCYRSRVDDERAKRDDVGTEQTTPGCTWKLESWVFVWSR
jgi:hypothetical protein